MYSEEKKKEIFDALKLIFNICTFCDVCKDCPFGDENGGCKIQHCPPCNWEIQDDQVWRAIK